MAAEDKFSLRWNDFESSLSASFQQFRGSLLDVEILCSSGAVLAAHRLVLCACSEVLREALLRVRWKIVVIKMISNGVLGQTVHCTGHHQPAVVQCWYCLTQTSRTWSACSISCTEERHLSHRRGSSLFLTSQKSFRWHLNFAVQCLSDKRVLCMLCRSSFTANSIMLRSLG